MNDDFLRHPPPALANRMPWPKIQAFLALRWACQVKAGRKTEDLNLFTSVSASAGSVFSNAGRPWLHTGLMVKLLYLKYAFNKNDEKVIQYWGDTPTWKYISGNKYSEYQWTSDPAQLRRFRKALIDEGAKKLLVRTIDVAVNLNLTAKRDLVPPVRDSTVQEIAIAPRSDSELPSCKNGWHTYARSFNCMRQRIIVWRLQRKVACKPITLSQAIQETEAECISIRKSHNTYEFNAKVDLN